MGGFDFSYILDLLSSVIPALLCVTVHELCHGYTALLLGDDTAKKAGRLTLNPLKHIDVAGLLMMVLFHVGWAKPVPVNMYRFENPRKGMALTALAGPVSNFILALLFAVLYGALYLPLYTTAAGMWFLRLLVSGIYISTGLGVFNLIPVSPLDGSKILFAFMNDRAYTVLMKYEKYGSLIMIALVASGILGKPLSAAISGIYQQVMLPASGYMLDIVYKLFVR